MVDFPVNSSEDPVDKYLHQLSLTLSLISRHEIWSVIEILFQAWKDCKQIFICGNGGSAATASHMVNDLNKLTIVNGLGRFKAFSLTESTSLISAWANDSAYDEIFIQQLTNFLNAGDVVIAISTSGNSANVIKALKFARAQNAITIAFTGKTGGQIKDLVDCCVYIPDESMTRQEDGHLILDHVITTTLHQLLLNECGKTGDSA